jgi:hypothetical protein
VDCNSDGQQSTNINKTKESLSSDGQQYHTISTKQGKFKQ